MFEWWPAVVPFVGPYFIGLFAMFLLWLFVLVDEVDISGAEMVGVVVFWPISVPLFLVFCLLKMLGRIIGWGIGW